MPPVASSGSSFHTSSLSRSPPFSSLPLTPSPQENSEIVVSSLMLARSHTGNTTLSSWFICVTEAKAYGIHEFHESILPLSGDIAVVQHQLDGGGNFIVE